MSTLAKLGYWGDGYDFSAGAREAAEELLACQAQTGVRLISRLPTTGAYDYIFFFEVIGYWQDRVAEIARLKDLLSPEGKIIFSFTKKDSGGFAEKATGNMKCFTKDEIVGMVERDLGLKTLQVCNYGFPLANALKPVLNLYYYLKHRGGGIDQAIDQDVRESGLASRLFIVRLASMIINPFTISPFAVFQYLFKNSDLGTGYIVVAGKK